MIADCANAVLRRAHVDEGSPPQVSEHWARRFLERHPEYHVHKQSVQEIDRKKAQDPSTIQWWLPEFKRICDEHGIQQCDIYKKNTSLKRQANELWDYSDPISPTYTQRLHTYFTGSLAQAQAGAHAAEDLAHTGCSTGTKGSANS